MCAVRRRERRDQVVTTPLVLDADGRVVVDPSADEGLPVVDGALATAPDTAPASRNTCRPASMSARVALSA